MCSTGSATSLPSFRGLAADSELLRAEPSFLTIPHDGNCYHSAAMAHDCCGGISHVQHEISHHLAKFQGSGSRFKPSPS